MTASVKPIFTKPIFTKPIFTKPILAKPIFNNQDSLIAGLLVVAASALSLGCACAMPFAAFATACALTLPRKQALVAVIAAWAVNQLIGFSCLGYPFDGLTLLWGVILGTAAFAALLVAQSMLRARQPSQSSRIIRAVLAFLASFIAYEAVLFTASLILGGVENYTLTIQARIFAINAVALPILLILSQVALWFSRTSAKLFIRPA